MLRENMIFFKTHNMLSSRSVSIQIQRGFDVTRIWDYLEFFSKRLGFYSYQVTDTEG